MRVRDEITEPDTKSNKLTLPIRIRGLNGSHSNDRSYYDSNTIDKNMKWYDLKEKKEKEKLNEDVLNE